MSSDMRSTYVIRYQGDVAAICGPRRFHLSPHIEIRSLDDPVRILVTAMCAFAGRIQVGSVEGAYSDERAERYARCLLIDDHEFAQLDRAGADDARLAMHFCLPVEQIVAKRADLAAAG